MTIKVYVPQEYLRSIVNPNDFPKPSEFWLNRPDSWMAKDLAVINITSEQWAKWNEPIKEHTNGRQLLKD